MTLTLMKSSEDNLGSNHPKSNHFLLTQMSMKLKWTIFQVSTGDQRSGLLSFITLKKRIPRKKQIYGNNLQPNSTVSLKWQLLTV